MSDKTTKEVDIKVGAPGAEKVPGLFARIGHEIHQMNTEARGGGLHGIETILKGAGVAAFAHFGAEAISKAATATKEWAEGTISVGEAWTKAAEGIPIVGSFVSAIKEGAGALDALREKMEGTFDERKYRQQFVKTKGEIEAGGQRFDSAITGLGGKAAEIGLDEPEKMRLHARQEWMKTGEEIEKLTKEADLLARKQISLYWGAFRDGPGKEDRQREYALVSAQLERERDQIKRMEEFRAAVRGDANQKAADTETQIVAKFYGGLASAAQGAMKIAAKTGFDFMNQMGAKLVDMKAERDEYRKDFMYQMQQDTLEFERNKEQELQDFEDEQKRRRPPSIMSYTAPSIEGRFLTGAAGNGANNPQAEIAKNTAETNKKLDENTAAIKDLARAINQNPAQIVYIR